MQRHATSTVKDLYGFAQRFFLKGKMGHEKKNKAAQGAVRGDKRSFSPAGIVCAWSL